MANKDVNAIVKNNLCIGCGFCKVNTKSGTQNNTTILFDEKKGAYLAKQHDQIKHDEFICPSKKMDMNDLSIKKHGQLPKNGMLGVYQSIYAGYANDEKIRSRAASGGMTQSILSYLFDNNLIDVAYAAASNDKFKREGGIVLRNKQDIELISGSTYHPVDFASELLDLIKLNKRFAFVGLPCEIASLEMLKSKLPNLRDNHIVSIGLFCGGINKTHGIEYYLNSNSASFEQVEKIDYRHGIWPGKIKLSLKSKKERIIPRIRGNSRRKILRYVIGFQGYWMLKRCRLCPDQISDFADIAVGDPHSKRFREKQDFGWSAIIARTTQGEKLLHDMKKAGVINIETLPEQELIASQGYTLDNRRHVKAYIRVAKLLGMKVPKLAVYSTISQPSFRHYVYAFVDLIKLAIPDMKLIRALYMPWQIFEYLFLTFAPNLVFQRIKKLIKDK